MIHVYWLGATYSLKQLVVDRPAFRFLNFSKKTCKAPLCLEPNQWADHSSLLQQQEGQEKKVAVVTGAGGTIGSEVVDLLHSFDFNVVAIGRTRPENLVSKYGNSIRFVECDLSDLRQVYKAADQIRSNYQRIEMLVCVAGTMLEPNSNSHPANRVEPHLMVNLLSHVQLFTRLRPLLEASLYDQPRAIFVSSATSHAGCVNEFLGKDEDSKKVWYRQMLGHKSYSDSKLLMALYAKHLGEILSSVAESSKIKVGSVHPGIVSSGVYRHVFLPHRLIINYILPPFLRSSKLSAAHVLSLAFDDNLQSGLYYEDGCPVEHVRRSRGMTCSQYSSEELDNLANNMRQVIHREL